MMSTPMLLGQRVDGVEDDVALGARHAGGRLVEQQHLGLQARARSQARPAAGGRRAVRRCVCWASSASLSVSSSCIASSITSRRVPAGCEHGRRGADALGDRDVDVLQHREAAEQPVDLEGAGDAELDPLGLLDMR